MRLSIHQSHVIVFFLSFIFGFSTYLYFSGNGYYSFLFWNIDKDLLAQCLGFAVFGLYFRWCSESPILPNQQGIQLFFGSQTGEVWNEGNFLFIPRPFWSIWKKVSVEHFSFTVATQNRTQEGHIVMVFATGRAVPENVQLLSKISQEGLQEQVVGLSMMAVGTYISMNSRMDLLQYPHFDISQHVQDIFGKNQLYGLAVQIFTTKVEEINEQTRKQFDAIARLGDMGGIMNGLKQSFPTMSEVELYAAYASIVGFHPWVTSHVIHGNGSGNNTILLNGNNSL